MEKVGAAAYHLRLLDEPSWKRKHNVFNERLLKPYVMPIAEYQQNTSQKPGPIEIEGEEEYKVEQILDSRKR